MQFTLEKTIWTQADFEQMGWHDCSIYGMAFMPVNEAGAAQLAFDIDYIFKWIDPIRPGQAFSFWISPCTLVFKDTFAFVMNVDRRGLTTEMLEVADLYMVSKVEEGENNWVYEWHIDLQEGDIRFRSAGFDQIVRQNPVFTESQALTLEERRGISFSTIPCQLE